MTAVYIEIDMTAHLEESNVAGHQESAVGVHNVDKFSIGFVQSRVRIVVAPNSSLGRIETFGEKIMKFKRLMNEISSLFYP